MYRGLIILLAVGVLGGVDHEPVEIRFGLVEPPVIAQQEVSLEWPISRRGAASPIEISSIAWVGNGLLMTSDRHEYAVFYCPIDPERGEIGNAIALEIIENERNLLQDVEALTVRPDALGGYWVVAMSSMSNAPDAQAIPNRRHLVRFHLGFNSSNEPMTTQVTVISGTILRDRMDKEFRAVGIEPYLAWNSDSASNTYRWGNLEGITWAANAPDKMLIAFRNPWFRGRAIVGTMEGMDKAFDSREGDPLQLTDLFALELSGRGICDMTWDSVSRGYLIVAADSNGPRLNPNDPYPRNDLRTALYWWSGAKKDAPILFARLPDMKVDGICRVEGSPYVAIASDEHDVSESRKGNQSVITLFVFTGIASNDRKSPKDEQGP